MNPEGNWQPPVAVEEEDDSYNFDQSYPEDVRGPVHDYIQLTMNSVLQALPPSEDIPAAAVTLPGRGLNSRMGTGSLAPVGTAAVRAPSLSRMGTSSGEPSRPMTSINAANYNVRPPTNGKFDAAGGQGSYEMKFI